MSPVRRLLMLVASGLAAAVGDAAAQDRYAPLVEAILTGWDRADVVCLGEDHGRKHDSDLRIALVRHPKFPGAVDPAELSTKYGAELARLRRLMAEARGLQRKP